jgi:hypothetical protein
MFRDLPTRVEGHLREHGMTRRRRRFHPMMFEEIFHVARAESGENLGAAWLFILHSSATKSLGFRRQRSNFTVHTKAGTYSRSSRHRATSGTSYA